MNRQKIIQTICTNNPPAYDRFQEPWQTFGYYDSGVCPKWIWFSKEFEATLNDYGIQCGNRHLEDATDEELLFMLEALRKEEEFKEVQ